MSSTKLLDGKPSRRKAKYGKKVESISEAASVIFPKEILCGDRTIVNGQNTSLVAEADSKAASPAKPSKHTKRGALEDITELFGNITIVEAEPKLGKSDAVLSLDKVPSRKKKSSSGQSDKETTQNPFLSPSTIILGHPRDIVSSLPKPSPKRADKHRSSRRRSKLLTEDHQVIPDVRKSSAQHSWLDPLLHAYQRPDNPEHVMSIQSWDTLIDPDWSLDKIAESSYAEVYKVSNDQGTSILKIMPLKPPKGPGSQRETSIPVEMVVSEVMIMNLMADLDGYVEFKEAHIIEGRPPLALQRAFNGYMEEHESFFPRPNAYHKGQLFLVLELGDAGTDVEHFDFVAPAQLWDLFLGVVTALASGEQAFGFEHRDLHEGNVCLRRVATPKSLPRTTQHRQGYSGYEISLLDYTLSRASTPHKTLHLDLEADPAIFASTELLQHQMYRRMRNWIFFRTHGIHHPLFDSPDPPQCGSWAEFEPYTNVIWLWYILTHVLEKYQGKGKRQFLKETEELRGFLHPDVRVYDGGFEDVVAVYGYCVDKGWIEE